MYLESLALLAKVVGGLAVLITLIYMAYQTRQNRLLLEQFTGQQAVFQRKLKNGNLVSVGARYWSVDYESTAGDAGKFLMDPD